MSHSNVVGVALSIAFCLLGVDGARAAQPSTLTGCASHTPPFIIFSKDVPVAGFSYELFKNIATQLNRKPVVSPLPWARCLKEVSAGNIDLAIDAYDDALRHRAFFYSIPYYVLTPQIFYRVDGALDPTQIKSAKDLEPFLGCGVREYTYEHYQLNATKLDRGAANDQNMLLKVQARHCDYAVEELEYVVGGRAYAVNWPDESGLRSFRPAWATGPKTHFLVGKEHLNAESLVQQVNQAIAAADKAGTTSALRKRYFEFADKAVKKP